MLHITSKNIAWHYGRLHMINEECLSGCYYNLITIIDGILEIEGKAPPKWQGLPIRLERWGQTPSLPIPLGLQRTPKKRAISSLRTLTIIQEGRTTPSKGLTLSLQRTPQRWLDQTVRERAEDTTSHPQQHHHLWPRHPLNVHKITRTKAKRTHGTGTIHLKDSWMHSSPLTLRFWSILGGWAIHPFVLRQIRRDLRRLSDQKLRIREVLQGLRCIKRLCRLPQHQHYPTSNP